MSSLCILTNLLEIRWFRIQQVIGKIWIIKCKFLFRYPITSFSLFSLFIASCIKNKTLMMFVDFYFGNCLVCSGPHRFLRRLQERERERERESKPLACFVCVSQLWHTFYFLIS